MNPRNHIFRRLWLVLLLAGLSVSSISAAVADDLKFEAVLIWGTNEANSPDPKHKPVSESVAKKLACFKYSNYFEVNRKQFTLTKGSEKVRLSKD